MSQRKLDVFKSFFQSEKAGGFVLIGCTIISLIIANTSFADNYMDFWHSSVDLSFSSIQLNHSVEQWINDGLMAIFFLLVGLEIERELYIGELSLLRNALLPILAAAGGMLFPALIHYVFNHGTATQPGFGIPMATDIAFALGILSLAGNRIPVSLKIFLTALAIIDDLGAIAVIAIFYTKGFSTFYFFLAVFIFLILFIAGKKRLFNLPVYLLAGIIMWYCMLRSGVHATIAGVLLAFAIPFRREDDKNSSYSLQRFLHYPVAFLILPLFALANTAIRFPKDIFSTLLTNNSLGIILGLILGKFAGIFLVSYLSVKTKIADLPKDLNWYHILGVSILGGIGFTMSIFIANLAFNDPDLVNTSKMSILVASLCAAVAGLFVLRKKNI
ncbi:MAG: Na+/H+ antiporter NhaA [Chitinophagaceae bacterium]|nr:Na+/H+ antiporter NhaA [Chitinophagaceae bacterium]